MNITGKIKAVQRDWITGKWNITFEVNEFPSSEVQELSKQGNLNIEVKRYKKKRSLDSNAYLWVLLQKIAEATQSDKWSIYMQMLQRYSREFTFVICKEQAVERLKELYRTCVDLGEVKVNGTEGHQIQVYFGSSSFDSKAMAVLLDGVISECKELGIDTLPPKEIERMMEKWGK